MIFLEHPGTLSVVFEIIQAAGGLATAAAFFFVWKQSKITQKELNLNLRSWLSVGQINAHESNSDEEIDALSVLKETPKFSLHLTAHGNYPAKFLRVEFGFLYDESKTVPTKDNFPFSSFRDKIVWVYPNTPQDLQRSVYLFSPDNAPLKWPQTIGFKIHYQIGDQKFEYGSIRNLTTYHNKPGYNDIKNEWAT
jgi:hypothetical protein